TAVFPGRVALVRVISSRNAASAAPASAAAVAPPTAAPPSATRVAAQTTAKVRRRIRLIGMMSSSGSGAVVGVVPTIPHRHRPGTPPTGWQRATLEYRPPHPLEGSRDRRRRERQWSRRRRSGARGRSLPGRLLALGA